MQNIQERLRCSKKGKLVWKKLDIYVAYKLQISFTSSILGHQEIVLYLVNLLYLLSVL